MGSPLHASPPPGGKLRLSIFLEEAQGKFSRHTGANEHQEEDGKLQNRRCSLVVVVQYVSNEANVDDTFGSIVNSNYRLQLSLLSTDAHITLGRNESHCLSVNFALTVKQWLLNTVPQFHTNSWNSLLYGGQIISRSFRSWVSHLILLFRSRAAHHRVKTQLFFVHLFPLQLSGQIWLNRHARKLTQLCMLVESVEKCQLMNNKNGKSQCPRIRNP